MSLLELIFIGALALLVLLVGLAALMPAIDDLNLWRRRRRQHRARVIQIRDYRRGRGARARKGVA